MAERKHITLRLYREELMYDIENNAYIHGDVTAEDGHARHQIMDIGQRGNKDRVARVLNTAYQECVNMLYPYAKKELTEDKEDTDVRTEPGCYVIELDVPSGFGISTSALLKELLHEYMVCRAVGDWVSISDAKNAGIWAEKVAHAKAKISSCINYRVQRVRRTLRPW